MLLMLLQVCGLSSRAIGQLLCQYVTTLCPDDAVSNLFVSSCQPEVPEQYNVSPTFLSLRDLSVYNVDACVASGVFDTTTFDSSRQLLAAVMDSLHAVDTARCLFSTSVGFHRCVMIALQSLKLCYNNQESSGRWGKKRINKWNEKWNERMPAGRVIFLWFGLMLIVPFIALTLLVMWQEGHSSHKTCAAYLQISWFQIRCTILVVYKCVYLYVCM